MLFFSQQRQYKLYTGCYIIGSSRYKCVAAKKELLNNCFSYNKLEFQGPTGPNSSSCRGLARFAHQLFRCAQQCEGASPTSVSPKQFFSLKLLGETPKKCDTHTYRKTNRKGGTPDIHTYRKTNRRGGDTGHTYIHTERLTE